MSQEDISDRIDSICKRIQKAETDIEELNTSMREDRACRDGLVKTVAKERKALQEVCLGSKDGKGYRTSQYIAYITMINGKPFVKVKAIKQVDHG